MQLCNHLHHAMTNSHMPHVKQPVLERRVPQSWTADPRESEKAKGRKDEVQLQNGRTAKDQTNTELQMWLPNGTNQTEL